jgi:hypothetical protein
MFNKRQSQTSEIRVLKEGLFVQQKYLLRRDSLRRNMPENKLDAKLQRMGNYKDESKEQ